MPSVPKQAIGAQRARCQLFFATDGNRGMEVNMKKQTFPNSL